MSRNLFAMAVVVIRKMTRSIEPKIFFFNSISCFNSSSVIFHEDSIRPF